MFEKLKFIILIAILVCLFVIANKPTPTFTGGQTTTYFPSQIVVQLGNNRIGIVETGSNSGQYGTILVLQFNDSTKTFELISKYNYSDFFRNPQNYPITR